MKLPSVIQKSVEKHYQHLNVEEEGVLSTLALISALMSAILIGWVLGTCYLGLWELAVVDSVGLLFYLLPFIGISMGKLSYQTSRLSIIIGAVLVTTFPIIFYGLDTLFTLHIVIIPISGILLFTAREGKKYFKYNFIFFIWLLVILCWYYLSGPFSDLSKFQEQVLTAFIVSGGISVSFFYAYFYYKLNNEYRAQITNAREKSDRLLLSIFPQAIIGQLKESNRSVADSFDNVTVIFIDIVGFTAMSATMSPADLVDILDDIFSAFDQLVDKYDIEKIKTIGDAYMAVCGLPKPDEKHCEKVVNLALEIDTLMREVYFKKYKLKVRIGIHTGKAVAGVIGNKKFSYDLWGDTVNVASRFESAGAADKIHITEEVKNLLGNAYLYESRGMIEIKGKGALPSYYLIGRN